MENKEKFRLWLLKMGNIHTADSERMTEAYKRIIEY